VAFGHGVVIPLTPPGHAVIGAHVYAEWLAFASTQAARTAYTIPRGRPWEAWMQLSRLGDPRATSSVTFGKGIDLNQLQLEGPA
jgi:hypothetical protein